MLQFLPYALAAYGGYKGYKASKNAGGNPLQRLLAGATGAAMGYYGGKMIPGVQSSSFTPFTQLGQKFPFLSSLPYQVPSQMTGAAAAANTGSFFVPSAAGQVANNSASTSPTLFQTLFQKPKTYVDASGVQRVVQTAGGQDVYGFDPLKIGTAVGLGTYFSGAFKPQPQDVYTPTYNLGVAELEKQRGPMKYIDPVTGDLKSYEALYIPEADPANQGDYRLGPYALTRNRFNQGGLAEIKRFNEGGVNYLPSKVTHDENDSNNYMRAQGYVEDGSGNGDKDEDTMLAQLADGEFVTRADGVLGAGIIAGANPKSMKDMRDKGAKYFYEQQKRFKRIFDLLEGSRNAKTALN